MRTNKKIKKRTSQKINFSRNPWRGIFSRIAAVENVTPSAIRRAYKLYHNPRIMELVHQELDRITAIEKRHSEVN